MSGMVPHPSKAVAHGMLVLTNLIAQSEEREETLQKVYMLLSAGDTRARCRYPYPASEVLDVTRDLILDTNSKNDDDERRTKANVP